MIAAREQSLEKKVISARSRVTDCGISVRRFLGAGTRQLGALGLVCILEEAAGNQGFRFSESPKACLSIRQSQRVAG